MNGIVECVIMSHWYGHPLIPDLMKEIELEYSNHTTALRVKVQSSYDNPTSIQKTIGHYQPEGTNKIVQKNVPDFDKTTVQLLYQELESH